MKADENVLLLLVSLYPTDLRRIFLRESQICLGGGQLAFFADFSYKFKEILQPRKHGTVALLSAKVSYPHF